jgi:hypothetical protein
MNNTLDIIKYISFIPTKSKVVSVIKLPVAMDVQKENRSYYYCLKNKKYLPNMLEEQSTRNCIIRTIFGDDYTGRWFWANRPGLRIIVISDEEMAYEPNHYLKSEHDGRKFEFMELE